MSEKNFTESNKFVKKEDSKINVKTEKEMKLPADETLKLIFTSDGLALIQFVNSVFKTNYPKEAVVIIEGSEFIDSDTYEYIFGDLYFSINGDKFHFEFQTKYQKVMAIRMFQYGTSKALENAHQHFENDDDDSPIIFTLPRPLVMYLEYNPNIGDTLDAIIRVSGNSKQLEFTIPVLKMWEYSIDRLVNESLYLLLPYALMKYRKLLISKRQHKQAVQDLMNDFEKIRKCIFAKSKDGSFSQNLSRSLYCALASLGTYLNQFAENEDFKEEVDYMLKRNVKNLFDKLAEEGEARGEIRGIVKAYLKLNRSIDEIAKELNMTKVEVQDIIDSIQSK